MRKYDLTLIAAIVAVVALIVTIPVLMTGCGGDDQTDAYGGRMAQKMMDRDSGGCTGRDGDCVGATGTDCDGDCIGGAATDCDGDCTGGAATDCDGDCQGTTDEPFGSEPICF